MLINAGENITCYCTLLAQLHACSAVVLTSHAIVYQTLAGAASHASAHTHTHTP